MYNNDIQYNTTEGPIVHAIKGIVSIQSIFNRTAN